MPDDRKKNKRNILLLVGEVDFMLYRGVWLAGTTKSCTGGSGLSKRGLLRENAGGF